MTAATLIRLGDTDHPWRFGAHVTVRALTRPWVGHNATSLPRYYEGQRPVSTVSLAVEGALTADDGRPDTWPGSPCTGCDTPWPSRGEIHLRWRRHTLDPRPVRGVLIRATTRREGRWHGRQLNVVRRVRLAEVTVDTTPPRRILCDRADLIPGWSAAA